MTTQQRDTVDQILRSVPFDMGGEVDDQRPLFADLISAVPLPDDVHTEHAVLGEVPVVTITLDRVTPTGTILYFHGGGYAFGSAALSAGLASELARRAGARAVSVDYALAPERPYPAAVQDAVAAYKALLDDGVAADDIVFAGESSGGGLALAAILEILSTGLPRPAAAYVASPWVDLTTTGESMTTKADDDPSLTAHGLRRRARDYGTDHDLVDGRISPVFADLVDFPALLIQVGGNEILLDDATRLATRAASAGVPVTLEVTPDVPHVFVGFAGMLDEADEALNAAGRFLRANLARTPG
ncbi:alpha/beta hydrolase [Solicola gregarius]|uniref:Alpha/beta hydrolase n=1 Tax=Solicola gregarius TaxID=2908642 RepID=A0AA46YLR1_9ACTN|nr:alpha/beta hydrolase [Solicola gregarius]UYM05849.1 alpha/beta hydrolase [Solicola gregarius]